MGLTLVTGPANSAKAQVVLAGYRAALARGAILVVPRAADVEHYRRELAAGGAVLGVAVESFSGLLREVALRAGVAERPLGVHARERILAAVVERSQLAVLDEAARAPAFTSVLAGFVAELEARRVTPARLHAALAAWAPAGGAQARYGEELASLYRGYRSTLERLGRLDGELLAARALDALRLAPGRWGTTAVYCYGFDDLDPLQLDTIETLAVRVGVPVTLSLPGEPGRRALAGRAGTLETLRPIADETIVLEPRDRHYEDPALHRLERTLFEDAPVGPEPPHRAAPAEDAAPQDATTTAAAVRLLEGGDERAEAELLAAEIAALVAAGCAPGDIAVVTRGAAPVAELVAELLPLCGIAHVRARREPFADTAVGGGLLALLRAGALDGGAADLVRWLRVPGLVARAEFVDRFEATLLRRGVSELGPARALWEAEHWPLDALDRLAEAARRGGLALIDRLERELDALFAAPWRREAALLDPWQAAVRAAGARALRELRELALSDHSLTASPAAITAALEGVEVEREVAGEEDAVLICDALALRARRVRALFIAGLQEGGFPAAAREPPFLSASERTALAIATGLVLGDPLDPLESERYLFYALCSRPTRWLRLSWHDTTDDGEAALRSLFVDDVVDCFGEELFAARTVRGAGTLRWSASAAPAGLGRLQKALRGPRRTGAVLPPLARPELLAGLRGRASHSASALESWTACPVGWFVDRALDPGELQPDEMVLTRGRVAHDALAAVLTGLRERTGSARLDAASLPIARQLLDEALGEVGAPLSIDQAVDRSERNRQRQDLARYLEFAAAHPSDLEPGAFELGFGLPDAELPSAVLADGGLELCGRIDRLDFDRSGAALIYDYKAGSGDIPGVKWRELGRLQPALYMLAVEQLLGVDALGGLYQALRVKDLRPRGAIRADVDPDGALMDNDRFTPGDLRALVLERLDAAVLAASEMEAGALRPRPSTCWRDGVCRHPAICRAHSR